MKTVVRFESVDGVELDMAADKSLHSPRTHRTEVTVRYEPADRDAGRGWCHACETYHVRAEATLYVTYVLVDYVVGD